MATDNELLTSIDASLKTLLKLEKFKFTDKDKSDAEAKP